MKKHSLYRKRISKLFQEKPKAQLTENRWKAVLRILQEEYPNSLGGIGDETMMMILADSDYIARRMRQLTQGKQEAIKRDLEESYVMELGYGTP